MQLDILRQLWFKKIFMKFGLEFMDLDLSFWFLPAG